ncbi:GNAT family N-acetyltransferase [Haladaptatus sp. DFWS20]|uniref:GNAT family N-acetyltransferase n=1 Tax=Haladaptatus sp. DFWS20 TaxID=3403467 RepID=UPI003EBFBADD
MIIEPIQLNGDYIRLEPLSIDDHLEDLQTAGAHSETFRWFPEDRSSPEAIREFVDAALDAKERQTALPFATVLQETGEAIGSTRFGNIVPEHRRVEIGWTWLTPSQQSTPANTEAKYLMLTHAFEEWDCVRVELKTDSRNQRSRDAIERIGATEEGTLRHHLQTHQGPRDTVYFSILEDEWVEVKRDLERKLERTYTDQ